MIDAPASRTCRAVAVALLSWAALCGGVRASSTASSASSDSASSTVGSASDSFRGSSHASSPGGRTAAGDFRVVEVAAVAERPGRARVSLEPVAGNASAPFRLELPQPAVDAVALSAGDVVAAAQRPFGVEFAAARPGQPPVVFFLVLDDDWHRALALRRVAL